MLPIGTDRPQRRLPWMNILLIVVNVIIFFFTRPHAAGPNHGLPALMPIAPAFMKYLLDPHHPELYQFITYQ